MKILKSNLKGIIGFIVGVILASGITVYAYSYFASDISYTKPGEEIAISVETALNDLYSKASNYEKSILDISNSNVSVEQNNAIDNTVSKTYTATEDELIIICVSETGDSRYSNSITTTGTIISDSNNLNTKTWGPEINRDWYINIRTITIKLTKDDTVTISSYGQCFGSGQYSITHIK